MAADQHMLPIQQAIDLAIQHHTSDRLPQAKNIYQQVLQNDPNHPVALHLLGVIAHQQEEHKLAVAYIGKALVIRPELAAAHSNLGLAYYALGELDNAVASYEKALVLIPDYAQALYNLGLVLKDLGRLQESVASYKKALVLNADYTEAHHNLAHALYAQGRFQEAVQHYDRATLLHYGVFRLKPDDAGQ